MGKVKELFMELRESEFLDDEYHYEKYLADKQKADEEMYHEKVRKELNKVCVDILRSVRRIQRQWKQKNRKPYDKNSI